MYMYCTEKSVNISIQGLTIYAFVLVMIYLDMQTFRLMVTMVAEFCSLVILIHNTLLGEIMSSSTQTRTVNGKLHLHSQVCSDMYTLHKERKGNTIKLKQSKNKKINLNPLSLAMLLPTKIIKSTKVQTLGVAHVYNVYIETPAHL